MNEKIYNYKVIIEPAEEGGYFAFAPLLQGCFTQGETIEQTKEMMIDAIKGYLDVLVENGEKIPIESSKMIETQVSISLNI